MPPGVVRASEGNAWLIAFVPAATVLPFLVAWLAGYAMRRIAPRIGLVDNPGHRKVHAVPMPLGGGVAIWLGVMLPLAAGAMGVWLMSGADGVFHLYGWPVPDWIGRHVAGVALQFPRLAVMLGLATVLLVLGLLDDLRGIAWPIRLSIQFAVAAIAVWFWDGWRLTIFLEVPWLTAMISLCWIVGLVNSFNLLDNMDGLSGGVALIACAMLAAVLLLAPDPATNRPQLFVSGMLLVLAGSLAGFLWHNLPPARLFMGDAGAYFIGFVVAMSTMMATFSGGNLPRHAILAPLFVLAVPIYDNITVVWIRLRQGRSPFVGDTSHFSHRLVGLGMTKKQAVLTIYLTTATCGLGALLLNQVRASGAWIIALLIGCVLFLVGILETAGRGK